MGTPNQTFNAPGTGTPGKPVAVQSKTLPPTTPTLDNPPQWGPKPIDLNEAAKNAGQANQQELNDYFKKNNIDEYNKRAQVTLEDQDEVRKLPGYSSMNIGQIQEAEKRAAQARADKWVNENSKAATSKDGSFTTNPNWKPETVLKNPTVTAESRGSVSETPIANRKGPDVPVKPTTTTTVPKTPEQQKKDDWMAALGNLFSGKNIGNVLGGLGAAIESAYGNRSYADTLFGRNVAQENARKAELEKLGEARTYETAQQAKQNEFAAQQAALDRANRLQVASGAKDVANNRDIALGLFNKSQQPGGTLTKEQVAFVAKTLGIDPMVVASGKLPQAQTGQKAFD